MEQRATRYFLRRAEAGHDDDLLLRLFVTQQEAIFACAVDRAQSALLLELQFRARNAAYAANFPAAQNHVICTAEPRAIGRLLVSEDAHTVHVIDLALLPEYRCQGVGTEVLRDLQHASALERRPITLCVHRDSPARRLYQRLGFQTASEDAIRACMVWNVSAQQRSLGRALDPPRAAQRSRES